MTSESIHPRVTDRKKRAAPLLMPELHYAAGALVLAISGCGASRPAEASVTSVGYPTALVDPRSLEGDWAFDHEVTITHAEGRHSFRAALEKAGPGLTLVALSPQGIRAFALTQTGREISFTPFVDLPMPFPPEYIMYDVHRLWLSPSDAPAGGSGEQRFERGEERVAEVWTDGRLRQRRFERADGSPAGAIIATYPEGLAVDAPSRSRPPSRASLENGWFGYRVDTRTLDWQTL